MTSIQGKGCFPQKNKASVVTTGFSSHKSDNKDYKNPLTSKKPPIRPFEALNPPLKASANIVQYTKKYLEWIIQTVF